MLIPKQNYIRDETFRRWIASLPCMRCGVSGLSQAAHLGKGGRGIKGCDSTCRPLCADSAGRVGCHTKLDRHLDDWWKDRLDKALERPVYEIWKESETQAALEIRRPL